MLFLRSLVALLIVAGALVPALPAGATVRTETWTLKTVDTTNTAWAGAYYQRYTVEIQADGTFRGTGTFLGTDNQFASQTSNKCYTQTISGRVNGEKSTWTAHYDTEDYWYNFRGTIRSGGYHSGKGVNVNGHTFRITSTTAAPRYACSGSDA